MLLDNYRIERLTKALDREGLDALLCRLPENVLFLSGWWPLTGTSWVVFSRRGVNHLIVPACEAAEAKDDGIKDLSVYEWAHLKATNPGEQIVGAIQQIARSLDFEKGRIGIEESFEAVAPPLNISEPAVPTVRTRQMLEGALPHATLVDATELIMDLRVCKTQDEIEKLRLVHEIASFGMSAFRENVAEGVTEIELAALVNAAIATNGGGYKGFRSARGFAQVTSGQATESAWRPCVITTPRKLTKGDIVMLELGVVADGFWADVTRTLVVGPPSEQQQEIYDLIDQAQKAAIDRIGPGVKMSEVDQAARDIIEKASYGEYFIHVTGHGVGWRYHEPSPFLHPDNDTLLQEGMVTSVEPGLYIPGFGGMRLEDNVAVSKKGADILTSFNRSLI